MAEYRLSVRARSQLLDIYESTTTATFGPYQAEAYHAGLDRTSLLADFPRIGQLVNELASGYRRFRFQSHNIFYTEEATYVLIRAIYHCAQDIRPQLFD